MLEAAEKLCDAWVNHTTRILMLVMDNLEQSTFLHNTYNKPEHFFYQNFPSISLQGDIIIEIIRLGIT